MQAELHPDCRPIAFLLGTWRGEGEGSYPTIEPFRYGEEIEFRTIGKPFLFYVQRTWSLDDGRPLHSETGYWRPKEDGTMELLMAYPTGHAELALGKIEGTTIATVSADMAQAPTAKDIARVERRIEVQGDVMRYEVRMAAVGVPLTEHLRAELTRAATAAG